MIGQYGVYTDARHFTVYHHHRNPSRLQIFYQFGADTGGDKQNPRHLIFDQQIGVRSLFVHIAICVAQNNAVVLCKTGVFDAPGHFGKKGVGAVGHDHADAEGLLAAQVLGQGVGFVVQLVHGLQNAVSRFLADSARTIYHMRDCGNRDACLPGNITDRSN